MKTIWKFTLAPIGAVEIPVGAKLLDVQVQNNLVVLWALVDPEAPKEVRRLRINGTGWDITESLGEYIATFQKDGLVFHVFDQPAGEREGGGKT